MRNCSKSLLDLPAELRNHIYQLIFPGECIYVTRRGDEATRRPVIGDKYARAITQVCRQTRHESLAIYFHSNTFMFELGHLSYLENLSRWLEGRFPCLHYRADLNEIAVLYDNDWIEPTEMGPLLDQLRVIFDFAVLGLDLLISREVMARPIRRAALAMRAPPTSPAPSPSLIDTCITEAFRLGALAKHNRPKARAWSDAWSEAFKACYDTLDSDMIDHFKEPWLLLFIPS